jgi:hypothetical protein
MGHNTWKKISAYKIPIGKPEGRRPLEVSKNRWEYNIKKGLKVRLDNVE